MSQITTCPNCQTRFRVTEEQLLARKGDVRCGRCSHVFNAYGTLAAEAPETEPHLDIEAPQPEAAHEEAPQHSPDENKTEPESFPVEETEPLPEEPLIDFQVDDFAEIESVAEPAAPLQWPQVETPMEANPEPEPEVRVVRIQPPAEKEQPKVSLERPKYGPPPKPKRAWPWVLASLLLVIGLAGQGVYFFRNAIAANYPPVRPLLEVSSAYLHCNIRLLQNPDLLSIESSELHADPARANIVVLTSTLRNRASYVQDYPTLELTLTNAKDEMVAKRLILPREYVRKISSVKQGIPAKGDVAVKLLMDFGDLKAEGYRLYLFYPS